MPISVTCSCGSRLEIDEKFLGKEIPCPDCGKPLPTKAPPTPPPLDLPDHRRVSGLAIVSLALGIVGFFTIIGSLAAIASGAIAIWRIGKSKRLDGVNFARAGVGVGLAGLLFTILIYITPLGLDFVFREFAYLTRSPTYDTGALIEGVNVSMKRPQSSGPWATLAQGKNTESPDKLIVTWVRGDAFISCIRVHLVGDENKDPDLVRKRVLDRLPKSELYGILAGMNGPPHGEMKTSEPKFADKIGEVVVQQRFGRVDRTFLVLYKIEGHLKTDVFVGCCRRSSFERLEPEFRDAFGGFRITD
jgi:hypothetical protein